MKKFYLVSFIILFIRTNLQIKQNPISLDEAEKLFLLPTYDDYYYVMTDKKYFKIKKESGNIIEQIDNTFIFDS